MMTFFINYKFQLFTKTFLLSVLLIGHIAIYCSGAEPKHTLDFSGNGPIFLLKKQIREDLILASRLFRDNYVRHTIFEQHGINWGGGFKKLESLLLKYKNPILRQLHCYTAFFYLYFCHLPNLFRNSLSLISCRRIGSIEYIEDDKNFLCGNI